MFRSEGQCNTSLLGGKSNSNVCCLLIRLCYFLTISKLHQFRCLKNLLVYSCAKIASQVQYTFYIYSSFVSTNGFLQVLYFRWISKINTITMMKARIRTCGMKYIQYLGLMFTWLLK